MLTHRNNVVVLHKNRERMHLSSISSHKLFHWEFWDGPATLYAAFGCTKNGYFIYPEEESAAGYIFYSIFFENLFFMLFEKQSSGSPEANWQAEDMPRVFRTHHCHKERAESEAWTWHCWDENVLWRKQKVSLLCAHFLLFCVLFYWWMRRQIQRSAWHSLMEYTELLDWESGWFLFKPEICWSLTSEKSQWLCLCHFMLFFKCREILL